MNETTLLSHMKNNSLRIRLSDRRKYKLLEYAANEDRTVTSLIEEWIDSLPRKTLPAIHLNTDSENTV